MSEINKNINKIDQAKELREIISDRREKVIKNPQKSSGLHTISILSGKGGVGKSNFAAALACSMSDYGKRAVLLDADLGMANLDILFGISAKYTLANLIDGTRTLNEVLIPIEHNKSGGSVSLLPGGAGLKDMADLDEYALERVFDGLAGLEEISDYLIMDAGAGIHKGVLSFGHASDITLLVTTPEPTSIRDAYGVLKSLGSYAWKRSNGMGVMLVVNEAGSKREAQEVSERIRLASMQFLGNAPIYLGYIPRDSEVEKSVRNCKIFYRNSPESPASECVIKLTGDLLKMCEGESKLQVNRGSGAIRTFLKKLTGTFFSDR